MTDQHAELEVVIELFLDAQISGTNIKLMALRVSRCDSAMTFLTKRKVK